MRRAAADRGIGERPLALKMLILLTVVLAAAAALTIAAAEHMARRDAAQTKRAKVLERATSIAAELSSIWAKGTEFPRADADRLARSLEAARPAWDVEITVGGAASSGLRTKAPAEDDMVEEVVVSGPAGAT